MLVLDPLLAHPRVAQKLLSAPLQERWAAVLLEKARRALPVHRQRQVPGVQRARLGRQKPLRPPATKPQQHHHDLLRTRELILEWEQRLELPVPAVSARMPRLEPVHPAQLSLARLAETVRHREILPLWLRRYLHPLGSPVPTRRALLHQTQRRVVRLLDDHLLE